MTATEKLTLSEFKKRFKALKTQGFVKSQRRGPTGVGHTLEYHLGISENNIALPDIGIAEIKAHRAKSSSLVTLFTFNRKVWRMAPLQAIKNYGTKDKHGRLGLYFTMTATPNQAGLFIRFEKESIDLRHIDGNLIATWNLEILVSCFKRKIPALIFVTAEVEERDGVEYYNFSRAQLLTGVRKDTLSQQFREGNIVLDLRLHDKGTSARNHGTGFRAFERNFPSLFSEVKDI
jgi:hypothetical protein